MNSKKDSHKTQAKKWKKKDLILHVASATKIPLSYNQISRRCNCSCRYVKMVIKSAVESGLITKESTDYILDRDNREVVYPGKNLYTSNKTEHNHLIINVMSQKKTLNESEEKTDTQKHTSKTPPSATAKSTIKSDQKSDTQKTSKTPVKNAKNFTTYINTKNLYKYKFAKENSPRHFSSKKTGKLDFLSHKRDVLGSFGFEEHAEKAPPWWFRDLDRLKSALRLLKNKLKKKFRCQNFFKFISYLLKRGTFGYRRHVARETSLAICKPTLSRVEPMMKTPPIEEGYRGLVELHKKHNLEVDFSSMEKLLRKRFPHLTMAVRVCLKRLSWSAGEKVKNINGFLNHLVGMKEPADYLKKDKNDQR